MPKENAIPKILEPCDGLFFDVDQIKQDITNLFDHLSFDTHKHCFIDPLETKLGVNLTHPPMEGKALELTEGKWPWTVECSKYIGPLTLGDKQAVNAGLDPASFTIIGDAIAQTYLGSVIEQVKSYHATTYPNLNPVTRTYCAYLNSFSGYRLHLDTHTKIKYHLPVITNDYSFMYTEYQSELIQSHLPADGRLWMLDPNHLHSALNMSPYAHDLRMHIIFSVYDDTSNTYESPVYRQP